MPPFTPEGNVPFNIGTIRQTTIIGDNGLAQPGYEIYWSVPGLGSFSSQFPKKDFDEVKAAQDIQLEANKLASLKDAVNNQMYPASQG